MHIEGYTEAQLLASGAASDTYRARLAAADRWLALKIFRFRLGDEQAERRYLKAMEHARAVATHPNIATVHDAGLTTDRQPYVAMDLVDGGSVADRLALASHGRYSPAEAARIGVAACAALAAAHRAGLIHRFLQPSSLLLDPDGRVVVTELGIPLFTERWEAAGYLDDKVPYHAPPEVLERASVGPAADVYSLASTLYTMVAGRPPRRADGVDSGPSLLLHILRAEVPSLPAGVPEPFDDALRNALTADPDLRSPTVDVLREALEALPDDPSPAGAVPLPGSDDAPAPEVVEPPPRPVLQEPYEPYEPYEPHEPQRSPYVPSSASADDVPWRAVDDWDVDDDAAPVWSSSRDQQATPGSALAVLGETVPEPVPDSDDQSSGLLSGWRLRALAALSAGLAIAIGVVLGQLVGTDRESEPALDLGGQPVDVDAADDLPTEPVPSSSPRELMVPTGLELHINEVGVLITWDETDTNQFAVLVLSEIEAPRVEVATGTSLMLASPELSPDGGYCFAVARLDMIGVTAPEGDTVETEDGSHLEDIGPGFSHLDCIRGAAADTVLLAEPSSTS